MTSVLPELTLILPELILVCGAMALLMVGVFTGDRSYHSVSWISVFVIVGAGNRGQRDDRAPDHPVRRSVRRRCFRPTS